MSSLLFKHREFETPPAIARATGCAADTVRPSLSQVIDEYVEHSKTKRSRKTGKKLARASIKRIEASMEMLQLYIDPRTQIHKITPAKAEQWRECVLERGQEKPLSEASVRTDTRNIKGLFKFAIRKRYVRSNPFEDLPYASMAAEKDRDITPAEVQRIIDACPNWQWRTFVGFLFYLGLRSPSETHAIKWSDIDWDRRKVTIDAAKTGMRVAPIRPELMALLDEAYEAAEEGALLVLDGFPKNNRHRGMHKIIKRAQVEPWSDLFQHARRCCRTRFLTEGHPPHAVSRWMGHGQTVGDKHYTMVSEESFDRVSGARAAKSAAAEHCIPTQIDAPLETKESKSARKNPRSSQMQQNTGSFKAPPPGLEPGTHGLTVHCSTN